MLPTKPHGMTKYTLISLNRYKTHVSADYRESSCRNITQHAGQIQVLGRYLFKKKWDVALYIPASNEDQSIGKKEQCSHRSFVQV